MCELIAGMHTNISGHHPALSLITLEPLQHFHGQRILKLMDEEICRYLARSPNTELSQVMTYIYDYGSSQPTRYAIKHQAFGLIGVISFGCFKKHPLEAVIGYWIGRPYQGYGYAKQAIKILLTLLRKIQVNRVLAEVFPMNGRSEGLLEGLCFSCADKTYLHNGQRQYYLSLSGS